MQLNDAIAQISEIRAQIARTETFRGYRSLTVGFSGFVALVAAGYQLAFIPNPLEQTSQYLAVWLSAAAVSLVTAGAEMTWRCRRAATGASTRLTWMAVEQFFPCVAAGGLVTVVITQFAESSFWMLPGLWSILFSLGIFSSARLLPRPVFWVAGYYLVAGTMCLGFARGEAALSPWAMAIPFVPGQTMVAAILYFKLERRDGRDA